MAVLPLTPFDLTNCPQCQAQLDGVIVGLGITMDRQGNLKRPNIDYRKYLLKLCIVCIQKGLYNFDLTLQCRGTFFIDRHYNDWVMGNWQCPQTGAETMNTGESNVITTENITLIAPMHPGTLLKAWFESEPEKEKQRFLDDTKIPESHLQRIFNAEAPIDREIALQMSNAIGEEAEFWFWMQLNFDEFQSTGREADKDKLPALFASPEL